VQRGELDLLVLELELGAVDGGLEGRGGLVAEGLVDLVAASSSSSSAGGGILGGVVVGRLGDRGEFEGQGELVVGFGDDFGLEGVELLFVLERGARVDDGVGVPLVRGMSVCKLGKHQVAWWSFTTLR